MSLEGHGSLVTLPGVQLAAQEVGFADEVRHELVHGLVVDGVGVGHLVHQALLHDDDAVGDGHGLGLVVRDVHGRDACLLLDATDLGAHVHAELGIQVGEGLVKEKDAGLDDQGSGQGHALLLATGELVGHAVLHALQAHHLEDVGHLALDLVLGHLAELEAVGHIVKDVVVREQGVGLEDHGGVALVGRELVDGLATQVDLALVGALEAGDHAQDRGLAAAGGTQQRHELARRDLQVGVVHGIEVLAGLGVLVDLGDVLQTKALLLLCHAIPPRSAPGSWRWCQSA